MSTAADLRDRRIAARHTDDPDLAEAERLKARLARARDNRISALLACNIARINLGQAMGVIRQFIQ